MMNNPASEHDLQRAIDEITRQNDGGAVEEITTQYGVNGMNAGDMNGEMGQNAPQGMGMSAMPAAGVNMDGAAMDNNTGVMSETSSAEMAAAETMVVPEMMAESTEIRAEAVSAGQVKEAVLRDLVPLMDRVEMEDGKKFDLYMEMATVLKDESVIAKAHEAARGCADEGERAKKLLKLVEVINSF